MPGKDGFEVLGALKGAPSTRDIPVVLLTVVPAARGERKAMGLGVSHYITKPWESGTVETAVKVALHEAGFLAAAESHTDSTSVGLSMQLVRTGKPPVDKLLDGGLPFRSLTLVEGTSSTGKSTLCQHLVHSALVDGHNVAYCSFRHTSRELIHRMESLGLDVSGHYKTGKLTIHPMEEPVDADPPDSYQDPDRLITMLGIEVQRLATQHRLIVCDDITNLASHSGEDNLMALFTSCKRTSERGSAIIVEARSYAFNDSTLTRLQTACDAHLSFRAERIGAKQVNIMEVRKLRNAAIHTANMLSFEVVPGIGLRMVPGAKIRL